MEVLGLTGEGVRETRHFAAEREGAQGLRGADVGDVVKRVAVE